MADSELKAHVRGVKRSQNEMAGAMESLLIIERVGASTAQLISALRTYTEAVRRTSEAIGALNALLEVDPDNPPELIEGDAHDLD